MSIAARKIREAPVAAQVAFALEWLETHKSQRVLDGMARYAIPSTHALGVAMKDIKALGTLLGRKHEVARALWKTGIYEARMLVSFVGDPQKITAAEMDRWARDFDNWAYPDTLAFNLFDRCPHAWDKVRKWRKWKGEFEKRAAYALLWALALHDRSKEVAPYLEALAAMEADATDERNFVKKAVNMALRAIARRGPVLKRAATECATRFAASDDPTMRWIGKDALREIATRPSRAKK